MPTPKKKSAVGTLSREMKAIHAANVLYWTASCDLGRDARSEYERRSQRLEELRHKLSKAS